VNRPTIAFGWGAPSFAEQLPALSPEDAAAADADNAAITRLAVRGIITEAEKVRAIRRATSCVIACLAIKKVRNAAT